VTQGLPVTPEKKSAFIAALVASGGSVARACQAIEIARLTAYRLRDEDPEFAAAWVKAKQAGLEALEDEALRRAYEGTDEAITYQGVITDTVKRYSDTLAIFLLKGGMPDKYKERGSYEVAVTDTLAERLDRAASVGDADK
jgi:hypothetical protein